MTSIANIIGRKHVDYRVMLPDPQLVLPDCMVGIEMELEGDTSFRVRNSQEHVRHGVVAKEDGSLRNGGVELVFAEPLMGDSAIAALKWMFKVKEEHSLVGSTRTSTHMHINYTGYNDTATTLINTVVTWLLVEKAVCLTAGQHREYNSFCVPTYMMNPREENLVYNLAAADESNHYAVNNTIGDLGQMERYSALNLSALFKYGTLECRLLGTADYQPTLDWLNILLSIKKAAIDHTRAELLQYTTLATFLSAVMPQVAELLIVNDAAEEQFTNARNGIISLMSTKKATATTVTTTPTTGEPGSSLVLTAGGLTWQTDDEVYDSPDEYTTDEVNAVLTTAVLDDSYWQDNALLGSDASGWTGPTLLSGMARTPPDFNFQRASELLNCELVRAGFDPNRRTDVSHCIGVVRRVLIDNGLDYGLDDIIRYSMRIYNLVARFDVVRSLSEAFPFHVAI
jgi:hypothetical protein